MGLWIAVLPVALVVAAAVFIWCALAVSAGRRGR